MSKDLKCSSSIYYFPTCITSWVTRRKIMSVRKEENVVEDEVTHLQLRGLEKNRSCSRSVSVKRKTHTKRRYIHESSSESSSQSSSESSLQSLAEYSSESSPFPSPKKEQGSGSKRHPAGLIKQKNYRQSTSHSPVSKKDKKSHGRKHEKKKFEE